VNWSLITPPQPPSPPPPSTPKPQDQAKFLPEGYYKCSKPSELADESSSAVEELGSFLTGLFGGKHSKKDDDDKKECKDIKDRKECRKAKAVCSWCNGKMAPSMCMDEVGVGGRLARLRWRAGVLKSC
jgi:hypothetical protein